MKIGSLWVVLLCLFVCNTINIFKQFKLSIQATALDIKLSVTKG